MEFKHKITNILLISLVLIFMSSFVIAVSNNPKNNSYNKPNCTNLYYLDNTHQECSQKKFCGTYMYEGLRTFNKISDCKASLLNQTINQTNSTKKENYGQCVSKATKLKNTCLKQDELDLKQCKLNLKNSSIYTQLSNKTLNKTQTRELRNQIELLNKQCSNDHKNSTQTCKSLFKEAKDLCEPLRCNKNQIFSNNRCINIQKQCHNDTNSTNQYNYTINNIQECLSATLNCSENEKPFYDECGCGCKSDKPVKNISLLDA